MKFREIFRFEFAYQIRRPLTWLIFLVVLTLAVFIIRQNFLADALYADFFVNSPFVISAVTVLGGLIWVLTSASVAGDIAARDVQSGMHPLTYTSPVSKLQYLGGRFLAALTINALILLAVPASFILAVYLIPGVDAEVIGPFRPVAYLKAYGYITLPNIFATTAIQFAFATLSRRAVAGYLGSIIIFGSSHPVSLFIGIYLGHIEIAKLTDSMGIITVIMESAMNWTPAEKATRMIALEGPLLWNRVVWISFGVTTLAFTYMRFQFVHITSTNWWTRLVSFRFRARSSRLGVPDSGLQVQAGRTSPHHRPATLNLTLPTFGFPTQARQLRLITWTSFMQIVKSKIGLMFLVIFAVFMVILLPQNMYSMETPLLPKTILVLPLLTSSLTNPFSYLIIIPLLIILYAGELVWREREARVSEITDTSPIPEWIFFTGKFLGLSLILVVWIALVMIVGVLVQLRLDYYDFELGLYLKVLFGLQLPDYLLFAVLALAIHTVVNQKHVGNLAGVFVYGLILSAGTLGVQHNLLIYGSDPGWAYNEMRGFAGSLIPWLWFKLYWAAWALFFAVAARLLWVRGKDQQLRVRIQLMRLRFTQPTAMFATVATGLIILIGGFIFYNTNVLNKYYTAFERRERMAEYERRYGRYKDIAQPELAETKLNLEIYPAFGDARINGTYKLVNNSAEAIDSIHLATPPEVEIAAITFNRSATPVSEDKDLGHFIYALKEPLRPGDSLQLKFDVRFEPRGFNNRGVNSFVYANGTYFTSDRVLPDIGYQQNRELIKPADRRKHGLPQRPLLPEETDESEDITGEQHELKPHARIPFEAVIGTDEGQTAIAPGTLRDTWTEDPSTSSGRGSRRRYFHYTTDAPIGSRYAFFSANYALREEDFKDSLTGKHVTLQFFHHPVHIENLERIVQSVKATMKYCSNQFGPYPASNLSVVESPVRKNGAHAEGTMIDYGSMFTMFTPVLDSEELDLSFAVLAHETSHQWWGYQMPYALVAGAGLLSESLAWYSAMGVVRESYGDAHLQRLRRFFRQPYPILPIRQSQPLLRAMDPYAFYRKGPFAMYTLTQYAGEKPVNVALARLIEKHKSGEPATPLDLYHELQAITPDSAKTLLHDLFEANTFWELMTKQASAQPTDSGNWQVNLDLQARKVVVNPEGVETEIPMEGEWIEVGVFAQAEIGDGVGKPLYMKRHRIHSGEQSITVTVPGKPRRAAIDPHHLMIDLDTDDNYKKVEIEE